MKLGILRKFNRNHEFKSEDAVVHGIEKACILSNVHLYPEIAEEDLYYQFPYIKKETFYILLNELVEAEILEKRPLLEHWEPLS